MRFQTPAATTLRIHIEQRLIVALIGGICAASCLPEITLKSESSSSTMDSAVSTSLGSQDDGQCSQKYNPRINFRGHVSYCDDGQFVKPYPSGMAFEIGFHWNGSDTDKLLDFGRGKTGLGAGIKVSEDGTLSAVGPGDALCLDGSLVQAGRSSSVGLVVGSGIVVGGPGFTLGQRLSMESTPGQGSWLKFAAFFLQMREDVRTPVTGDFATVSESRPESRVFFDSMTDRTATTWSSSIEGRVACAQGGPVWVADYESTCP